MKVFLYIRTKGNYEENMFDNLDDFLENGATLQSDASGNTSPRELQIATAALLIKMASIDEEITSNEISQIVSSLNIQFQLSDAEAGSITEVADYLVKDQSKVAVVAKKVKESFSHQQKLTILALLYKVMMGDGSVSNPEATLAANITELLGLNSQHFIEAKEMVKSGQV